MGQDSEVVEEPETGLCWEASEEHAVEHGADPDNLVAAGHSCACNHFGDSDQERMPNSGFLFFDFHLLFFL